MSLENEFQQAAEDVKGLAARPDNETLLRLYGLYKQGSQGDVAGKRPGLLQVKERAKFDAWTAQKGVEAPIAMRRYIDLVQTLTAEG